MSDNPNFEESAKSFRKAVKGLGTDESRVIFRLLKYLIIFVSMTL